MSALDDMQRYTIKLDAGAAGHVWIILSKQITLTPLIMDWHGCCKAARKVSNNSVSGRSRGNAVNQTRVWQAR